MYKIGEREPYSSRIFATLLLRASKANTENSRRTREKPLVPRVQGGRNRSFRSSPSPPREPWESFLAGHLMWLAVDSIFAARELQEITLSIASLLLNCFVNLAPLGLYFSLIFSLIPKTIHRETQPKLVQQTNMRNWRTCVWSRKSKWFVILKVPDYVTRKKLRVEKERYLLTRERNDYNLGEKVMRFLDFLIHRMPIPRIWYRYDPSPHPTLVKIVWSESEMMQPDFQHCFFFRLEGGVFVVASSFKSLILKLDMVTSIFLKT